MVKNKIKQTEKETQFQSELVKLHNNFQNIYFDKISDKFKYGGKLIFTQEMYIQREKLFNSFSMTKILTRNDIIKMLENFIEIHYLECDYLKVFKNRDLSLLIASVGDEIK